MKYAVVVIAALLSGCGQRIEDLPFFRSAAMTPEWLTTVDASSPSMHRVASFRAIDQTGSTITDKSFAGRVTVAHFFFTSCGDVCPTTTHNLQRMLGELPDKRVQVLSYSVTPARDSIAELRRFIARHHVADTRWHFLTGDAPEFESLARNSYFVRLGPDTTYGVSNIAHTESILLVDSRGRLRGVYAGSLPLEIDRLRDDVKLLLRATNSG